MKAGAFSDPSRGEGFINTPQICKATNRTKAVIMYFRPARRGHDVGVSKHDREDYEQGRHDREKGVLENAFNDITVNHPDSAAYYKGRDGEQLDEDKDDD